MSKKGTEEQSSHHDDGHVLIAGARWHFPKMGAPTECAVAGCDRLLGQTGRTPVETGDGLDEETGRDEA